ncbi:MAG: trypsin-like peptidase domain-containing protein [Oscillospiraceae bacterium]|nr:trypsin-like peptidase domain-containing protein [Oscillospiraceae bacterium]
MDKRTDGPNDNEFEVIYDYFDNTEESSTSINPQDNLHVNKTETDNIYEYSYENLNSSPQERIKNLDKAEPETNSRVETQKSIRRQRKKTKSNFFNYFLTGLICSLISIFLSVAFMLYVIPDSKFYKDSLLSKELDSKINAKVSSAIEDVSSNISRVGTVDTKSQDKGLTSVEVANIVSPAVVGISSGSTQNYTPVESFGSGVIFREDGYILTNYHVVQNTTSNMVQIVFYDNKTVQGKIVNFDKNLDIAVVKVDNYKMPGVATLGDSSILKTGEQVLAFGSPLGRQYLGSVSAGIVSSPSRLISVSQNNKALVIQTDAAINFGNSGGPLVNSMAQVIGINSSKITELNGTNVEGMGFAIPINEIKPLLDENVANNLIVKNPNIAYAADTTNVTDDYKGARLGVKVKYISGDEAKGQNQIDGLLVSEFSTDFSPNNSPAEKAGIKPGDVILSIDGKKVTSALEIREIIQDKKTGDKINVQIQESLNDPPKNVIVTF